MSAISLSVVSEVGYSDVPEQRGEIIRLGLIDATREPRRVRVGRDQRDRIEQLQNRQCAFCGRRVFLEMHHVGRVSRGGSNEDWNLFGICHSCHKTVNASYGLPVLARIILAIIVLTPESLVSASACYALFALFLRSRIDSGRYATLKKVARVDYESAPHLGGSL